MLTHDETPSNNNINKITNEDRNATTAANQLATNGDT